MRGSASRTRRRSPTRTEVGSEHLRTIPHMEPVRKKLMQQALDFYRGFLEERSDDPSVRKRAARVMQRVGDLEGQLGDPKSAEASYRRALTELDRITREDHESRPIALDTARCLRGLAKSIMSLGRAKDAATLLTTAISKLDATARGSDGTAAEKSELADCLAKLGELQLDLDVKQSEHTLRDAASLYDELAELEPSAPEHIARSAKTHQIIGIALEIMGVAIAKSSAEYRAAADEFESLTTKYPDEPRFRFDHARALMDLGSSTFGLGPDGESNLRRAIEIEKKLVEDFPDVAEYRRDLPRIVSDLGMLMGNDPTRLEEARKEMVASVEASRGLVVRFKDDMDIADDLARTLQALGQLDLRRKDYEHALEESKEAVLWWQNSLTKRPQQAFIHRDLAGALHDLARVERTLEDYETARTHLIQAVAEERKALVAMPNDDIVKLHLRFHLYSLADSNARLGRVDEAIAGVAELESSYANVKEARRDAAAVYAALAALADSKDASRVATWKAQAIASLDEAIALGFHDFESLHQDRDFRFLVQMPEFVDRETKAKH